MTIDEESQSEEEFPEQSEQPIEEEVGHHRTGTIPLSEPRCSAIASNATEIIYDESKGDTEEKGMPSTNASNSGGNGDDENDTRKRTRSTTKSILGKVGSITKRVNPFATEKEDELTEFIVELPRDILTAFFLLKLPRDDSRCRTERGETLPPYWNDFSRMGRFYLWLSVIIPYAVQFFVLFALMRDVQSLWDGLDFGYAMENVYWNSTAFSVLFLYMFKDLVSFYSSVWFYISWLQKRQGGLFGVVKGLGAAAANAATATKDLALTADNSSLVRHAKKKGKDARKAVETHATFMIFKIWLTAVLVLYAGLTIYSLLSIPMAEELVDKLEVSLSVFIVLEVDDWAYDLFIGQENILDDEEFNVTVFVKKDRASFVQRQERVES